MILGLFRKVKVVKVKRSRKPKKAVKLKVKRPKIISKKPLRPRRRKSVTVKKAKRPLRGKVSVPQIVGKVTHYFPRVKAGVILVTGGSISLGDTLLIKGHTTNFQQKVSSLQINNMPIKRALPGQEIGLLVKSRVRCNDVVYKL